jgi:hypothetical protein
MSAILKPEPFETIFDHGVTDAEIQALTDGYPETQEEYFYGLDHDSAYADLFRLYRLRGDTDKAAYFMEKIEDNSFKFQFKARPCCSVHS